MNEDNTRVLSVPSGPNIQRARVREQPRPHHVPRHPSTDSAMAAAAEAAMERYPHGRQIAQRLDEQNQFRNPLFQQSVTLTAKMWPEKDGLELGGASDSGSPWRISGDQLPLVVGAVTGGLLLVMLLVAAILWRFCILPRRDKEYRVRMGENTGSPSPTTVASVPSHSAVFADPKNGRWAYNSRLVTGSTNSGAPSSAQLPAEPTSGPGTGAKGSSGRAKGGWVYGEPLNPSVLPGAHPEVRRRHLEEGEDGYARPLSALGDATLFPQISEFSPGTYFQYASSGVLDERHLPASASTSPWPSHKNASCITYAECDPDTLAALRSRSLPASSRARARWLAETNAAVAAGAVAVPPGASAAVVAADAKCLDELYAKVNFSKKRRNRMRRDEAAIIALSKSRSELIAAEVDVDTCLDASTLSVDTGVETCSNGILKDDAVIVYDERTAV